MADQGRDGGGAVTCGLCNGLEKGPTYWERGPIYKPCPWCAIEMHQAFTLYAVNDLVHHPQRGQVAAGVVAEQAIVT